MFYIIGALSGFIFIVGDIPYILDIIKGNTKPQRVTWLVFFILDLIYLVNQIALGAKGSLILLLSWTLITLLILILSIKNGVGGFAKLDIICLTGVVIGLILWWILKTPLASVICNILVSLVGYIPTLKKSYLKPWTETKISWFTASIAGLLGMWSVGKLDIKLLILPTYSFIMAFIVFIILYTRSKNKKLVDK